MIKRSASYIALLFLAVFAVYSCGTNTTPAGSTVSTAASQVTNPNPNNFNPKGTVSGVVADFTTQKPIAGATVYITDKSAITGAQGQFTITGVAANLAVGNEPGNATINDPYIVTVDMTAVNNAIPAAQPKYPAIVYNAVTVKYDSLGDAATFGTNATNHDTPVDGFVASMTVNVGKLDANIVVQAVNILTNAPVTGAAAELISTGSNNSTTGSNLGGAVTNGGAIGHIVATGTTSAAAAGTVPAGAVVFSNVEAGRVFNVRFTTSTLRGESGDANNAAAVIQAQSDGVTSTYTLDGIKNNPIFMSASDVVNPIIASNTPANLADIAPNAATAVVFQFSEPIKQTIYAQALTSGAAQNNAGTGLYNGVTVNSLGPKAGNTAYTLSWNATFDALTVTFATDPSTKYSVSIAGALGGVLNSTTTLTDNAGNPVVNVAKSTITFSTNGGPAVATAPATLVKNPGATNNTLYWTPVTNAYKYRVYVETQKASPGAASVNWVGTGYQLMAETALTISNLGVLPFSYNTVANGVQKARYNVRVVGVSSDLAEGPAATLQITDTVAPQIFFPGPQNWNSTNITNFPYPANGSFALNVLDPIHLATNSATWKYGVIIDFNEQMDPGSVMNLGNWSVSKGGLNPNGTLKTGAAALPPNFPVGGNVYAFAANDALPVITDIFYDPTINRAYIVVSYSQNPTQTAVTDANNVEFMFTGTDVTGNGMDPLFDQMSGANGAY